MTLTPESSPILIQTDFSLAYDSAGNVGTITHTVVGGSSLATFAYAYDAANRLTHETNAEGSVTYTYDNTNQLTSATGARSESYAYDVNGNRNATGYTVGTGGTLSASPNATYAYDSAGHVTAKTDTATGKVTTFAYDYRDRLTGATRKTSGGVVDYQVTYTYDALNRRIGEKIDADGAGSGAPVQTWTLFDGQNPYADFTGSGTLKVATSTAPPWTPCWPARTLPARRRGIWPTGSAQCETSSMCQETLFTTPVTTASATISPLPAQAATGSVSQAGNTTRR